jgi:Arm DNA-binding domain
MALTDTAVRNAKPREKAYKIDDGGGLYLLVTPAGGRLWRLKYRADGVERKLAREISSRVARGRPQGA